jgi:tetratricopeptide (TPR) repeat protein
MTFPTPEEVIARANNTSYGLSAGVWTDKGSKIFKIINQLRASVVWANTYNKFDPSSPFGGYKENGFGREGGRHGLIRISHSVRPPRFFSPKTVRAVLISLAIASGLTAVAGLMWFCQRDPRINFLPLHKRAEWIIFPSAVEVKARGVANLDALFRRDFTLQRPAPAALLTVRAAKQLQLTINDRKIDLVANRNWKDASTVDVSGLLHEGLNRIEARVFNDNGPPALWLSLIGDQLSLRSDQNWIASFTGSAWRPAAFASSPRFPGQGSSIDSSERTITSLTKVWPLWLLFGAVALLFCAGGNWWLHRHSMSADWTTVVMVFGFASLWLILFWHNAQILPSLVGFDASHHLNYIKYLQEHRRLPLPTQGMVMFHPPLYYLISAVVLSFFNLNPFDPSAILLLRTLTMLFGIAQFFLVFATLRLIFPNRPDLQLVAGGLAAFLPMQLYLSHYPTNETLAALLVSASIYFALRMATTAPATWRRYCVLGLVMGAALLTKASAVLVVPFIGLALVRQLTCERASVARWAGTFGSTLLVMTLICGWHYIRISRYGSPLVGSSDPVTGAFWWQDDGYHTIPYFARFGQSLIRPLFSATASFSDGLYSTLWGDGLCSGVSDLSVRPPWNYNLMCAGYLLSLVPTLLLFIGVMTSVWQLFREPRSDIFIFVGLSLAVAVALLYYNLKVPCYGSTKAFYGLSALLPLSFFAAIGWNVVTDGRKWRQLPIAMLLTVWAMNSFGSFWIYDPVAQHIITATHFSVGKKSDAALAEAKKAVTADPSNAAARIALASALDDAEQSSEALEEAEHARELAPLDGATHLELGTLLLKQNKVERAVEESRLAVAYAPQSTRAHLLLLASLLSHKEDATEAAREALAVSPYNAEIHRLLGVALVRKGEALGAFNQLSYSVLIRPDWTQASSELHRALLALINSSDAAKLLHQATSSVPDSSVAMDELAWIFATHPSEELRDGPEAVRLAEHACALTKRTNPLLLATLAAAYAETGNFAEAINTIEESIAKARSNDNTDAIALGEKLFGFFQANKPIRQNPNSR